MLAPHLKLIGYLILAEARTNMRALIRTSLMNLGGNTGSRVRGSVEKAHSQFENTTVGNFETLEETSSAGPSFKINRIFYPGYYMKY